MGMRIHRDGGLGGSCTLYPPRGSLLLLQVPHRQPGSAPLFRGFGGPPWATAAPQGAGGGHAVMFSHGKAGSALPELKISGELGKQITSGNDSIGPFGFPWCLLPPPPISCFSPSS